MVRSHLANLERFNLAVHKKFLVHDGACLHLVPLVDTDSVRNPTLHVTAYAAWLDEGRVGVGGVPDGNAVIIPRGIVGQPHQS